MTQVDDAKLNGADKNNTVSYIRKCDARLKFGEKKKLC